MEVVGFLVEAGLVVPVGFLVVTSSFLVVSTGLVRSAGLSVSLLESAGSEFAGSESNSCEVTDAAIAKKIMLLLEKLDEHDDVQNVYSNFEASDEIMASLDV